MAKFDKLFVYETGDIPCGIIDGADKMPIDKITRIGKMLHGIGRYMTIKPIKPGDFDFDEAGAKINRITTSDYPIFVPKKHDRKE